MDHRSKYSYWDRAELLETVKETHQELRGKRPEPGLYDELEIKALEAELADLKGDLIKKHAKFEGEDGLCQSLTKSSSMKTSSEPSNTAALKSKRRSRKHVLMQLMQPVLCMVVQYMTILKGWILR